MKDVSGRLIVFVLVGVALVFSLLFARDLLINGRRPRPEFKTCELRLLTYQNFLGAHGPGEEILKRFEKAEDCKVRATSVADAGTMLERLKLAPSQFDVVLGLDPLSLVRAKRDFRWQPIPVDTKGWYPEARASEEPMFAVIDWSPLTFIYRENNLKVPSRLAELSDPSYRGQFTVADPHANAVGLQFALWVDGLGHGADWLDAFAYNVYSIAPTWTYSYGLFEKKKTRFVFTYLTSLAFHWGEKKDRSYRALAFPEGHPRSVEFAAIPEACQACETARKFVTALYTDEAQILIMRKNFMFPVRPALTKKTVYAELPKLKAYEVSADRSLKNWDRVFAN